MRLINSLADRVLGVVAPKASAGACVPPNLRIFRCGCSGGKVTEKNCAYDCAGKVVCSACKKTTISC